MSELLYTKPTKIETQSMNRLLWLGRFVEETAKHCRDTHTARFRGIDGVLAYAMNTGRRLQKDIMDLYKKRSAEVLEREMSRERILDISCLLDELVDIEDIDAVVKLVQAYKQEQVKP
jgi:hypothetical protein